MGSEKVVRLKEENAVCNKCNWQVNISLVEIQGLSDKRLGKESLFNQQSDQILQLTEEQVTRVSNLTTL